MIAEEPLILGFPAITPRDAIERPDEIDVGCLAAIIQTFAERETAGLPHPAPQDYCITNTSERVVNLILGTARSSSLWDGIRKNEEAVGR
jgi:UDP-N-acetylglucosamine 2-epimerase